jgi:hypothetical protein
MQSCLTQASGLKSRVTIEQVDDNGREYSPRQSIKTILVAALDVLVLNGDVICLISGGRKLQFQTRGTGGEAVKDFVTCLGSVPLFRLHPRPTVICPVFESQAS